MIVLGIATLNYAMKEFIALVGLICDFFLQLVFFPTVLAIDLRRLEVRYEEYVLKERKSMYVTNSALVQLQ